MKKSDFLAASFIESLMRNYASDKDIRVTDVQPLAVDNSASILAVLTAGVTDKPMGHFGLAVTFLSEGMTQTRRMVMKVKPHGKEIVEMLQSLALACGGKLAQVYGSYKWLTGFHHTHMRELEVYSKLSTDLFPQIFGIHSDHDSGTFIILMEYLEEVDLLNSVMTPEQWTDEHIRQALTQMASWHAQHLQKDLPLNQAYWDDAPSREYMIKLLPLWGALLDNAAEKFPQLYSEKRVKMLQQAIDAIPDYWLELEQMPMTLVHNDMNPRNTCFKSSNGSKAFCVYDWELATYHVPQYDIVEFLCFVLDEDRYPLRTAYLDFYRQALHTLTGLYADSEGFTRGCELAAFDFGLHRLGMYIMAHSVSPYPFLPRVVNSYFDTLEQLRE